MSTTHGCQTYIQIVLDDVGGDRAPNTSVDRLSHHTRSQIPIPSRSFANALDVFSSETSVGLIHYRLCQLTTFIIIEVDDRQGPTLPVKGVSTKVESAGVIAARVDTSLINRRRTHGAEEGKEHACRLPHSGQKCE